MPTPTPNPLERAALIALYNATDGPNWTNSGNWLSEAPLSRWHGVVTDSSGQVIRLNLSSNQLHGFLPSELSNLTNLRELRLVANSITTDLSALSGLSNLTHLTLDYIAITDISTLSGLTNLRNLSLSDTNIPDLSPLSGLTKLTHLRLIATNTTDVSPLSSLTNLTTLVLSHNGIEDISPLSGLTDLTVLGLGLNNVSDISALSSLTNLTELWLNNNNVTDISPLTGLTNLTHLQLHFNNITDTSALSGLTNLQVLNLASNSITDISPLSALTNLQDLDLRNNPYEELPKGDYDIELVFLDDFTESQERALQYAARRWMAVVVGDLPDYQFAAHSTSGGCGGHSWEIPSGERIDDLRIYVAKDLEEDPSIHGTGGINILREESHLPVVGCMTFDLSHANVLITGLHEIGHVLGFSAWVWNKFGYYQKPPDGDGHFNGPLAIAAFDDAGGQGYEGARVPLHNGDSHWSGSVLEGELMTPNAGSTLSAITVQALADLGYDVDVTQADDYTLPGASAGE